MTKVIVTYTDGLVRLLELDAVGDGDAGDICASSATVGIVGGALVFEPQVMPWTDGRWRAPTGVLDEWTTSEEGLVDSRGICHDMQGYGYSKRNTVKASYTHKRYVLLTPQELEGATSVVIDGSLAYCREGKRLVPVAGDGESSGGMSRDFAMNNKPATVGTTKSEPYTMRHSYPAREMM